MSENFVSKDPLHGKTLEWILTYLVQHFGWEDLARIININCFNDRIISLNILKYPSQIFARFNPPELNRWF